MSVPPLRLLDIVFVHSLRAPHLIEWHTRSHAHAAGEWELHYFLGGSGAFRNGTDRFPLRRGALHLTPPERSHQVVVGEQDDPITYYALLFAVDDAALAAVVGSAAFGAAFPRQIGLGRRILFEELKARHVHENPHRRVAAAYEMASFIYDLASEIADGGAPIARDQGWSIHVDRALSLFQEQLGATPSLGAIAGVVGVTPEHLIRLFKARFGIPPMAYHRRLKMEAATSYLLNSTASIKEIAWRLGYADAAQFSAAFRRFSGATPTHYRRAYYRSNPTDYGRRVLGTRVES